MGLNQLAFPSMSHTYLWSSQSASHVIVQKDIVSPQKCMDVKLSFKALPVELIDDRGVSETRKTKKLNHSFTLWSVSIHTMQYGPRLFNSGSRSDLNSCRAFSYIPPGPAEENFCVDVELIWHKSSYSRAAVISSFDEASNGIIMLSNAPPATFELVCPRTYTNFLFKRPTRGRCAMLESSANRPLDLRRQVLYADVLQRSSRRYHRTIR